MRKVLFLLAILPMLLFTACSSSDDDNNNYESQLIGSWVEDTESTIEVLHFELKSDHTGTFWATDNGEIDSQGKKSLVWSAADTKFTVTCTGEETETSNYQIVNGKFYVGEIMYIKQ